MMATQLKNRIESIPSGILRRSAEILDRIDRIDRDLNSRRLPVEDIIEKKKKLIVELEKKNAFINSYIEKFLEDAEDFKQVNLLVVHIVGRLKNEQDIASKVYGLCTMNSV